MSSSSSLEDSAVYFPALILHLKEKLGETEGFVEVSLMKNVSIYDGYSQYQLKLIFDPLLRSLLNLPDIGTDISPFFFHIVEFMKENSIEILRIPDSYWETKNVF